MSVPTKAQWRMEVEWVDSTLTHQDGWVPIATVLKRRRRRDATRCLSVGFVLADDDAGIVLAATVHGNEVAGITHIPTGAIVSRKRLRDAEAGASERIGPDGGWDPRVDSGGRHADHPNFGRWW